MPPGADQRFFGLLSERLGVKLGHQGLALQAEIGALGAPERHGNEIQQAPITLLNLFPFNALSSIRDLLLYLFSFCVEAYRAEANRYRATAYIESLIDLMYRRLCLHREAINHGENPENIPEQPCITKHERVFGSRVG